MLSRDAATVRSHGAATRVAPPAADDPQVGAELAVAYTQIVTISTDNILGLNDFRGSVGADDNTRTMGTRCNRRHLTVNESNDAGLSRSQDNARPSRSTRGHHRAGRGGERAEERRPGAVCAPTISPRLAARRAHTSPVADDVATSRRA